MHRTTIQTALAVVLAAVFVAPVAAVEPGGNDKETLSGTLQALWVESPGKRTGEEQYELRTRTDVVPLVFGDGGPDDLAGARVDVTGTRVGKALHVAGSTPGKGLKVRSTTTSDTGAWAALDTSGNVTEGGTSSTYSTAATTSKSFAIILINFTNLTTQPFTKSAVQSAASGSSTSLKAFYEEESKGRLSVSASVYGWYTINATTTGCDWRTWHTLGADKATAAGVNLSAFTNIMFIWPDVPECGFAGVAYVNGNSSYLNGNISVQVMTHEVGHNFGLGHANARQCTVSGTRVWLADAASCTTQGYADPFSTMGNNALRHNHGSQLGELGWLSDSEKVVGTPGHSYTIAPYFGSGAVKLVRIPRGDGTYFDIDFRTPYGNFDNFAAGSPAVSGATLRIGVGTASPTGSPKGTELLDTTPSTTDLKDAPLLVGKTVKDPVSTISFTTTAVASGGVTVQVKEGIKPGAPGSASATATDQPRVDLAWGAASDNIAVASYKVTRNGAGVGTIPASATSWTDTGVAYATAYTYAIAAVDTSGNTGPAVSASVTTPANPNPGAAPDPTPTPAPPSDPIDPNADVQPPTAPEPLAGTPTVTTVSLTWGQATDDRGVGGYRIARNGNVVATVASDVATWKDTSRQPSTTYTYSVVAVDTAGNASTAASVAVRTKADTVRPSTPRNFRVVSRSGTYVTFAWSRSTDNVKVKKYRIYREGRTRAVAWTTGTKIRMQVRYRVKYYVRAFDTSGNRSYASRHVRGR